MMFVLIRFIQRYWIALTAINLGIITVLSLIPIEETIEIIYIDKVEHMIAYMALAIPVSLKRPRLFMPLVLFFICYGIGIEIVQAYVGRVGDVIDVIFNITGIALAIIMGRIIGIYLPGVFQEEA